MFLAIFSMPSPLQVLEKMQETPEMKFNPLWTSKKKKLGSNHSKNVVLGLKKPFPSKKSAREDVFWGLKQHYLSGMTQIFFKKSVHKGLNHICEFFC